MGKSSKKKNKKDEPRPKAPYIPLKEDELDYARLLDAVEKGSKEIAYFLRTQVTFLMKCRVCTKSVGTMSSLLTHKRKECRLRMDTTGQEAIAEALIGVSSDELREALINLLLKPPTSRNTRDTVAAAQRKKSRPPVVRKVPETTRFINGMQMGPLPKLTDVFRKDKKDCERREYSTVVMPRDPNQLDLQEMNLRNRYCDNEARDFNETEERPLMDRLSAHPIARQYADLAGKKCLHPDCSKELDFKDLDTLAYHITANHPLQCNVYQCLVCGTVFDKHKDLRSHVELMHNAVRWRHKDYRESQIVPRRRRNRADVSRRSMSFDAEHREPEEQKKIETRSLRRKGDPKKRNAEYDSEEEEERERKAMGKIGFTETLIPVYPLPEDISSGESSNSSSQQTEIPAKSPLKHSWTIPRAIAKRHMDFNQTAFDSALGFLSQPPKIEEQKKEKATTKKEKRRTSQRSSRRSIEIEQGRIADINMEEEAEEEVVEITTSSSKDKRRSAKTPAETGTAMIASRRSSRTRTSMSTPSSNKKKNDRDIEIVSERLSRSSTRGNTKPKPTVITIDDAEKSNENLNNKTKRAPTSSRTSTSTPPPTIRTSSAASVKRRGSSVRRTKPSPTEPVRCSRRKGGLPPEVVPPKSPSPTAKRRAAASRRMKKVIKIELEDDGYEKVSEIIVPEKTNEEIIAEVMTAMLNKVCGREPRKPSSRRRREVSPIDNDETLHGNDGVEPNPRPKRKITANQKYADDDGFRNALQRRVYGRAIKLEPLDSDEETPLSISIPTMGLLIPKAEPISPEEHREIEKKYKKRQNKKDRKKRRKKTSTETFTEIISEDVVIQKMLAEIVATVSKEQDDDESNSDDESLQSIMLSRRSAIEGSEGEPRQKRKYTRRIQKAESAERADTPTVRQSVRERKAPNWMDKDFVSGNRPKKRGELEEELPMSSPKKRGRRSKVKGISEECEEIESHSMEPPKKRGRRRKEAKDTRPSESTKDFVLPDENCSEETESDEIMYTPNAREIMRRECEINPIDSPGTRRRKQDLQNITDNATIVQMIAEDGQPKITLPEDIATVPVYLSAHQREQFFSRLVPVDKRDPTGRHRCKDCGLVMNDMREGRRHVVGHIRVIRLRCSLCKVGAFFCSDMRNHLMFRHCERLDMAPNGYVFPNGRMPSMSRDRADTLTQLVDPCYPGHVSYTSGKIISVLSLTPYLPDAQIEEKILGPTRVPIPPVIVPDNVVDRELAENEGQLYPCEDPDGEFETEEGEGATMNKPRNEDSEDTITESSVTPRTVIIDRDSDSESTDDENGNELDESEEREDNEEITEDISEKTEHRIVGVQPESSQHEVPSTLCSQENGNERVIEDDQLPSTSQRSAVRAIFQD